MAKKEYPGMKFYLGCEFHSNLDMTDMLRADPRYRMCGTRYILLEFSSAHDTGYIRNRTYALISSGFTPVIAHCERYRPVYRHIEFAEELCDMGAMLQINANSVLGMDGFGMKMFCRKMLKKGLVSFIGSDAHKAENIGMNFKMAKDLVEFIGLKPVHFTERKIEYSNV